VRALLIALAITGCKPSATVENTMPVANLQSYRTVALRVKSTAFAAQGYASFLEKATLDKLRAQCGFERVESGSSKADITLDLNITSVLRGGGGMIHNPNQATVDTLLVISDSESTDVIGTARIRGKSRGMLINNSQPESEAVEQVAISVASLLAKSGCSGPRVAKVEPPDTPVGPPDVAPGSAGPVDPGPGSAAVPPPDEARRPEAEQVNEEGKEKLRSADLDGALAAFERANQILADAKYVFNACLTFEAKEQWGKAIETCGRARSMNPQPKLLAKIDNRLALLKQRQ
jgi:hypothetical protein